MGRPSFVQVYAIDMGLPAAIMATVNGSPSTPTAVEDGGGANFGGSENERTFNTFLISTEILQLIRQ